MNRKGEQDKGSARYSQGCHPGSSATAIIAIDQLTDKDLCQIVWIPSLLYQLIDSIFHAQIRPQLLPDLAEDTVGFFYSSRGLTFNSTASLGSFQLFRVGCPGSLARSEGRSGNVPGVKWVVLEYFQDRQNQVGAGSQDSKGVLAALSEGSIYPRET